MEKIINHGLPHIAEQIFDNINTDGLIQLLKVSKTWEVLAENVLLKRWKGKMLKACQQGESKVVQLLLERCNSEESGLNTKDEHGGTSFMWACQNGHADIVKLLLHHPEFNAGEDSLNTAFEWACSHGHTSVVQVFLDFTNIKVTIMKALQRNYWNVQIGNERLALCVKFLKDKKIVNLLLDSSKVEKIIRRATFNF